MIAHLVRGLRILGERWWNSPWITESKTDLSLWVRRGMKAVVWIAVFRVVSASWPLLGIALLIVVVLALRAATKAAAAPDQKPAETAAEPPADGPREVSPHDLLTLLHHLLADAPAVHLATLARHLTDTTGQPWIGDDVRAACRAADIPIRPKVRDLGGDRVSSGVHRDDLPPLPQPIPEEAQEGPVDGYIAGQDGNATPLQGPHATAPTPTIRRVGDLRITSTPDAQNPHRTHVQVADPTRKKTLR